MSFQFDLLRASSKHIGDWRQNGGKIEGRKETLLDLSELNRLTLDHVEAIAIRLESIASRVETIATRVEAIAILCQVVSFVTRSPVSGVPCSMNRYKARLKSASVP